jgi:hypothetical protein
MKAARPEETSVQPPREEEHETGTEQWRVHGT